ncbi:hypothetical protein B0T14DRAFT_517572 [Immersiella caudata]|uniref:Uncharacterized protein n=1 Tax=Immersiella caudata TaxID=314043 RepID=A0AA39WYW0_9PEZI|nr:hypothetical protein B0T14DRAFT_517572 [Immersiella caudata]
MSLACWRRGHKGIFRRPFLHHNIVFSGSSQRSRLGCGRSTHFSHRLPFHKFATSQQPSRPITMPEYPGWQRNLRYVLQNDAEKLQETGVFPMGIHHGCYGCWSEMLTLREVAMILILEQLTDKPDWHIKIFDPTIIEKWTEEALAWPNEDLWKRTSNFPSHYFQDETSRSYLPTIPDQILDRPSLEFVIRELQQKAGYFQRTGIIPSLDASHSVAKSDTLVDQDLRLALRSAFDRLKADQASHPDWHPNTNDIVQDLVHPSMYPLVYGRSLFLPDEVVGVDDAVEKWAGKGEPIPKFPAEDNQNTSFGVVPPHYWSDTYQWLPANLRFTDEGGVKFTSYINNLHPSHRGIYTAVEKLVDVAIPLWDQCLRRHSGPRYRYQGPVQRHGAGQVEPRIQPDDPDDDTPGKWDPSWEDFEEQEKLAGRTSDEEDWVTRDRWTDIRIPLQSSVPPFSPITYDPNPSKSLRSQFKSSGLQVIVKMASIELTPEKPEFSPGQWHVEGQMNEHIVATALYYLDSENITESHLEFRTLTDQDNCPVGQDAYHWMESIYGAKLGGGDGSSCVQNYGSVVTREGRLLAFPNVFQHRVSGFKLADASKPGHRRFIALWLVDPLTRIISTANVPPQQAEWWAESVFGPQGENLLGSKIPPELAQLLRERNIGREQLDKAFAEGKITGQGKLPPEVLEMVRGHMGEGLSMSRDEAERHRLELMKERTGVEQESEEHRLQETYNFCEH